MMGLLVGVDDPPGGTLIFQIKKKMQRQVEYSTEGPDTLSLTGVDRRISGQRKKQGTVEAKDWWPFIYLFIYLFILIDIHPISVLDADSRLT